VRNGLPTFVRKAYEERGVRIGAPYYVLERMHFTSGKIPDISKTKRYDMIWKLGLGASALIFMGGVLSGLIITVRVRGADNIQKSEI